jgi:anti-anti-sigma factor
MGASAIDLPLTARIVAEGARVIVDLSDVSFLASLGIRGLMSPAKALRARGGELVLLNPQPAVLEVLRVAGLTAILKVFSDRTEAEAGLAAHPAG